MSDADDKAPDTSDVAAERRTNLALRSLVSEMLERVRELSRRTAEWTPEERAQAEAALEAIMASVRREAARSHTNEP
jgi:hypothetical protein